MKKLLIIIFVVTSIFFACEKEDEPVVLDELRFEADCSKTGMLINYKLDSVYILVDCDAKSWKFTTTSFPKNKIHLYASADSINATLNLRIYYNNKLVADTSITKTSSRPQGGIFYTF